MANDVFDLSEYEFSQPENFSSANLLRHRRYTLSERSVSRRELIEIAQKCQAERNHSAELSAPFPQADDFERVMDMASFLAEGPKTSDDIATNYDFHLRQSDYYFSALKFLGLAENVTTEDGQKARVASQLAHKILSLPPRDRKLAYAELLLGITQVREAFMAAVISNRPPNSREIEESISKDSISFGIAGSTIRRRAQTIHAWTCWLLDLDNGHLF